MSIRSSYVEAVGTNAFKKRVYNSVRTFGSLVNTRGAEMNCDFPAKK